MLRVEQKDSKMSKLILSVCVFLFAWYISSSLYKPRKPPLANDDFSEFFDPAKVQLPRSEAEIIEIIKNASQLHHQVRVLGSGHSRNSLAFSKDVIISLEHYKGVVSLDRKTQEVTIRSGSVLEELVEYLDENGLALGVLPAILEQTIAGTIATATHGCRTSYGNLATLVTKLRLVTAAGTVLTLSAEDDNRDLFQAAQVSLGLLGVITEVTLQCEPAFNLQETMEKGTLDECLTTMDAVADSAEHVKLWVEVFSKSCDIYRYERTEKKGQMNSMILRNLKMRLWEPFLWLASWLPSMAPAIIRHSVVQGGVFYPEYTQVGKSYELLTAPLYVPNNKQTELTVDAKDCASALKVFEGQLDKWRPASMFLEVRFVAPDDIWLSADYGRQSCHITVIIYNPSEQTKEGYFDSLHREMQEMGLKPRPHFGKYFNLSVEELDNIYPKYSDFKIARKRLDPGGLFLNDMLSELF